MTIKIIDNNKLILRSKSGIRFISLQEILYFERFNNMTYIITSDDEFHTRNSLKSIEKLLPKYYKRAHRSFIININKISELRMLNTNVYEAYFPGDKQALITKEIVGDLI
ncbi:LytTR family DNA-binding domain-containing protein [Sporosarcina saromensis]|uniref:LytTR family DNA-binding domain-containing protein n=1 Tax=Sporosarcina saromensis TaxID=359365 RepID=A0ABU4GDQ4_9BACL|nr:LytTR family DNA-binding domain-containing protein [Sporosarcina saromensis]MDW0115077.1 LytTR family DNA-binding domain-containing protein [Sporosarcina saromensis]